MDPEIVDLNSLLASARTPIRLMRLYDEYGLKQPAVSPEFAAEFCNAGHPFR